MNKSKEEYSYSHSSGAWGDITGKSWGDLTKEHRSALLRDECMFMKCINPCRQCPIECPIRVEEFSMETNS